MSLEKSCQIIRPLTNIVEGSISNLSKKLFKTKFPQFSEGELIARFYHDLLKDNTTDLSPADSLSTSFCNNKDLLTQIMVRYCTSTPDSPKKDSMVDTANQEFIRFQTVQALLNTNGDRQSIAKIMTAYCHIGQLMDQKKKLDKHNVLKSYLWILSLPLSVLASDQVSNILPDIPKPLFFILGLLPTSLLYIADLARQSSVEQQLENIQLQITNVEKE